MISSVDTAYLGLDPGKSGAITVLAASGKILGCYSFAKETPHDIVDYLEALTESYSITALVENVHSSPQMGVVSAFSFGFNTGVVEGILTALRIPFSKVRPMIWQKAMNCLTKGNKNITKQRAQQLFPSEKVTHAIADSLIIAEYHRRESLVGTFPKK